MGLATELKSAIRRPACSSSARSIDTRVCYRICSFRFRSWGSDTQCTTVMYSILNAERMSPAVCRAFALFSFHVLSVALFLPSFRAIATPVLARFQQDFANLSSAAQLLEKSSRESPYEASRGPIGPHCPIAI